MPDERCRTISLDLVGAMLLIALTLSVGLWLQPKTTLRPRATIVAAIDPEATRDVSSPAVLSKLASTQAAICDQIVSANNMFAGESFAIGSATVSTFIPEEPKKDSSELGLEGARALASERAESAAPKGDVSWFSSVTAADYFSLTAWNTPQVQVPHFCWAASVVDGGASLALTFDFPPRADAGYETALPDGTFPEPDSREAFAKSSTRKELADLFYGEEAASFVQSLQASPGAAPAGGGTPSVPAVCGSPLKLDIIVPLDEAGVETACKACEGAATLWLRWMAEAEKLDQRRTMMVFARDSKVRAACLASTVEALTARYGAEDGRSLAMADAGPLDIADRGSAQNAAAKTNFDDSEKDQSVQDMMQVGIDLGRRDLR